MRKRVSRIGNAIVWVAMTFTAQNVFALSADDNVEITVKTEVQDQIIITGLNSEITIIGDTISDWVGTVSFKVKRQGADFNNKISLPYQLQIDNKSGGSGQNFFLQDGDNTIPVLIEYETDNKQGNLVDKTWSEDLQTNIGLTADQTDQNNISLIYTIPREVVQSARSGTYEGVMTVIVTAR